MFGTINWNPLSINTDLSDMVTTEVTANERRTAVHELFHVLGFTNPAIRT